MATPIPPFTPRASTTPPFGPQAAAVAYALQACPEIHYDAELLLLDSNNLFVSDLTPWLVRPSAGGVGSVTHQSSAEVPASCALTLATALAWGADRVQPALLVSSPFYQQGAWQRFPAGVFITTTPQISLQDDAAYTITGYELTYLLQSDLADSFVAAGGTTYKSNIETLMRAAGQLGATADLSSIASFPGDWAVKTVPLGADMTFPLGSGSAVTYIQAVNELLKASGMRPLFNDPNGIYQIQVLSTPGAQPIQWTFADSLTTYSPNFPRDSMVSETDRVVQRDVYNIPNEWVFIQQGLTFTPVNTDGSDGKYVVENTTHRPSDQVSVHRKLTSTQFLNASGQADLIAQGNAIVAAVYAQAEKINLTTAPWGAAGHYDVFRFASQNLPDSDVRKVQAQQWTLSIFGDPMTWQTLVVANE